MTHVGYHKLFHPSVEDLVEPIRILPQGTKLCEFLGTEYQCCQHQICFEHKPCKVRDFRRKYGT